ncbi:hypothetical protein VU04_09975, partial [Desulfobulbus sp. TB]|nr:hypothetical protein [Desulfobulbus sp. TB]
MKMEGHLFPTPENYIYQCTARKFDRELNLEKNLSRVYQYATLRELAEKIGYPVGQFEEECKKGGIVKLKKNYKLAENLTKRYNSRISEYLREVEYDLSFPLITYFIFPDLDHLKSRAAFLDFLDKSEYSFDNKGE